MPQLSFRFLLCCLAFLHSISTTQAAAVVGNHNSRVDRQWRNKKRECEQVQCQEYSIDEGMNCVNECISLECFTKVYAQEPLEDGEIDSVRNREFVTCLRRTYRMVIFSSPIMTIPYHLVDEKSSNDLEEL